MKRRNQPPFLTINRLRIVFAVFSVVLFYADPRQADRGEGFLGVHERYSMMCGQRAAVRCHALRVSCGASRAVVGSFGAF